MSAAREAAYATLRAGAPRPAIAGDVVEAFVARFTAQAGQCARLASLEELPGWLQARFATDGPALPLALAADGVLEALPWRQATRLACSPAAARAQVPLAVTSAFAGVAETGALALHPRPGAPMALNFLPERLVVVVRSSDIVPTLEDFWSRSRARFGNAWPRGLCLVAGPSSTGDIAMTLTTGAHGPVEVHALIV